MKRKYIVLWPGECWDASCMVIHEVGKRCGLTINTDEAIIVLVFNVQAA
jgi:hypothetical protein